jgi:hypothetical protein
VAICSHGLGRKGTAVGQGQVGRESVCITLEQVEPSLSCVCSEGEGVAWRDLSCRRPRCQVMSVTKNKSPRGLTVCTYKSRLVMLAMSKLVRGRLCVASCHVFASDQERLAFVAREWGHFGGGVASVEADEGRWE